MGIQIPQNGTTITILTEEVATILADRTVEAVEVEEEAEIHGISITIAHNAKSVESLGISLAIAILGMNNKPTIKLNKTQEVHGILQILLSLHHQVFITLKL
ncbi:hypothetical protein PIB30_089023 [Stylosanthes scabra]|uniref:Uncharacterized protein n=1 Tax=Stylosanthes scabra TaxID=79078 RepID=A0ABU6TTL4_9FABA|nr:hypothetical protein [Stylosanthes scabra]